MSAINKSDSITDVARNSRIWGRVGKFAIVLVILGCLGALAAGGWRVYQDLGDTSKAFVYYQVTRSDLPLIVTERGNLESQLETTVRCEVENSGFDRSGNSGTQIIFIVPNGSAVKKDDVLVELDSAAIRERLDEQRLSYDKAVSALIQAQATYDNQITQNETDWAQAELNEKLAELQLAMYLDSETGTFQLALDDIERQIDEAKNAILEARSNMELKETTLTGIKALFKLGYRGQSELDQSNFDFMRAKGDLTSAVNSLTNFDARRKQLENYEFKMQKLQLDGDVETARRNKVQVETDNQAKLAKTLAAKVEAEKTRDNEKDRLDRLTTQLELCEIKAPHDGMVVYDRENSRYGSSTDIGEGAMVRQRQSILTLPDLSQMQVKTQVHEAVLDQIRPGLPVTVKVDALNRTYDGVVHSVAVVPTSSYYTSIKTYDCVIRILDRVENLKPGMTAVVDIHVERLSGVLAIPVQAVVQVNRDTWCYVQGAESIERRLIELGRSNDKFVHVVSGLSEGERVILNTDAIFDESEGEKNEISPEADAEEAPEISPEVLKSALENSPRSEDKKKVSPERSPKRRPKSD